MKSAIALITLLAAAGSAVAQNCAAASTPYTQALKLSCQGNEMNFNWPNYQNTSQFVACQGQGRPLLLDCAAETYFSYVLQSCVGCADLIPSQPCSTLQISKTSSCVDIGATTTAAPATTTTTKAPAVTTTTTKAPAVTTTTTKAPVTTTPAPGPASTAFPPAPSPVTVDPDIPTPPTAAPTPPPVEAKPPTVVIPN